MDRSVFILPGMRILVWAGLGGLLLRGIAAQRVVDLDVFHEMALFREALARGYLPTKDPFAYTPTVPAVVHHEWGSGAVFYALWEGLHLGPLGLSLLRFALLTAILAVSYRTARRNGATLAAIAITAPATLFLLGWGLSPVRAQLFTFLFVAVLLLLLELDRAGERRWIAPWLAAYVLWVNLHGGFVVGLGMVAAITVERGVVAWRAFGAGAAMRAVSHLLLVGAAMVALALVNPYGVKYLAYLARALAMPRPEIAEWAPLWDPRVELTLVLVFAASLAVLAYVVAQRGVARTAGLAIPALFALAALRSQRHLPLFGLAWFGVVAPALVETGLGRTIDAFWERRRAAIAALLALVAGAGIWAVASKRTWDLQLPNDAGPGSFVYPVGAVDYLTAHAFTGNVLTTYEGGSYVMWRLHPAVKVSLDSRYEAAYQDGVFEAHRAFYDAAPGWEAFLSRYATDAVLLPCAYPVVKRLDATPGWTRAYGDATFCLHVRNAATAAHGGATAADP
jgi:hypothetical protein